MRMVRPAFAFVLVLTVQSLCARPGVPEQGQPTAPPVISTAVTSATVTSVPEATTVNPETATPQAESVGTINLVLAQVESGPPDHLQFLAGIQDFHSGDEVRVTGGGKGKLDLKDGTQLTMFNNTKLSRVEVSVSPPEADIFLQDQGFLGKVPEKSDATVRLPNGALILILGTRFFVLYNAETQVATAGNFDGLILYTPPGGTEQELAPGRMVNIPGQGAAELMELPFTPEQFEASVDSAGTPTAGLTALIQQYQIEPIVFTGQEVARMTQETVTSAAFSPDGKYVVSGGCETASDGCEQGGVHVWEALGGAEVMRLVHGQFVRSVAFSPDGRYVVSGSCDDRSGGCSAGSARVWEISTGKEIAHMNHESIVSVVAFSPDSRYVLSGDGRGTIRVWEALTNSVVAQINQASSSSIAFSLDNMYAVSGSNDGIAQAWDLKTSSAMARKEHVDPPSYGVSINVAMSPNGNFVASGIGGYFGAGKVPGTNFAWEPSSDSKITSVVQKGWLHEVPFKSIAKYAALSNRGPTLVQEYSDPIIVWEPATGTEVARLNTEGMVKVTSLVFSPDGRYLAAGISNLTETLTESGLGMVVVWEVATGQEVARMNNDQQVQSVAFSPDGNYVVSGTTLGTIVVWDASHGREVSHMSHADSVSSVAFSPDGKYVLSTSSDGTARVWRWQP